ncbi:Conserved_hypothetical protein [Hexamita inflata]|uniref:Uncharacterized protein n=1 Tax=Hexamita inflata TaxID=28002 RepID=A0AA86NZL0_9EUKA|nr:Conserved hypothetical protein [Hexamita inflata]
MQVFLSHQSNFFQMLAYSQLSLKNSRQFFSSEICSNINVGNKLIGYCLKESFLSSRVQSGSVTHSPGNQVHYTLYATKAQDLQMNVTYQMADLPSFALFGLTQSLQLQNSNFSVYVPQQLAQGALVCFQCDVNASTTDFLFSASGQNISGLVMAPFKILVLDNSFTQFRLNGVNVGGVLLNGSGIDLSLVECNISGHITSQNVSGSIAAFVGIITVHASNVKVCANVGRFGQGSANAVGITDICNLCRDSIYAYGLCVKVLENSHYTNSKLVCLDSFYFDGEECSCPEGYVANGTSCVKILISVNNLITAQKAVNASILDLTSRTQELEVATVELKTLQQNCPAAISSLNLTVVDIKTQVDKILGLITNLTVQINCTNKGQQYVDGSCVDVNCQILGQKPVNGICQCTNTNAIVQNNICVCPQFSTLIGSVCTGPENSVLINGTFKCVGDLIMQAGVCSCPTAGAAFYNGACTCGVNGQNVSNTCSCPANSVLVSGVCTCNISGQTMKSGACACTTSGAFVNNGACTCGIDSLNISNTCSCPANSNLIGGKCTCSIAGYSVQAGACSCNTIGAFIKNGVCTCGVNSLNISNTCSCPANSVLESGVCICSVITGQIMQSVACVCSTAGAVAVNGACTCGVNGVNNSNVCSCPANSVLVGNACTCNVISGQTMVSGACACSTFGAFVSGSACTCGVNGLNNSNTCSCPANSVLVSGVCTCNVISGQTMKSGVCSCNTTGAFVSNGACTCGVDSLNMTNTCSCPASSSLVGGKCTCSITGQTVQAGACACFTSGAFVSNGACTCGTNSLNTSNVCSCPQNSNLVSGVCTCNISGQSMQSGACVCPSGQSLVNGVCSAAVIINGSDSTFQCSQSVYVTTFDIQTATNLLPTPLSFSQYQIFASSSVVTNAFIDISDNVYTTVNPLFQSQTSFTNIKIQIGTQTMTSGSILTPNTTTTLTINQMNILSKAGTTLTLSSWLNILVASSTNTKISTLLVNLNFAMSSGSITLINTASGSMNITGYVVLGNYQSTSMVAMISVIVSSGIVNISQVSFKPTVYNVGIKSSYLFGNITSNSFSVSNVAIVVGNSSYQQVLTSTSSTGSNQHSLGGIITNIFGSSKVTISNVISDCYQQISTSFLWNSGFIIGCGQSSSISVIITSVCMQQKITSSCQELFSFGLIGRNLGNSQLQQVIVTISVQGTQLQYVGLIGCNQGNSSLQQVIVTISAQGTYFYSFGLVGEQSSSSLYAEVVNARTIITLSNNTGSNVGALFGYQAATNCSIQNASVFNSSIISQYQVGGLIGYFQYYSNNSNISVQNSTVSQSNISGSSSGVGGLIGICSYGQYDRNSNISIQNSTVQQSNISGLNNVGGFIGYQNTFVAPSSSYTTANASTLLIQNSNIFQNNISGSQVGGFIGNSTNYKTTITGCKIQQVRITAINSYVGIVLGYNTVLNTFTFSSSSSIFNYINNVLQYDCATFSNAFTQIGC